MSHRGESMEENDTVMSIGNSLSTGDELMGEEGLALAAAKRSLILIINISFKRNLSL